MNADRAVLELQRALPAVLGDDLLALIHLDAGLTRLDDELWLLIRPETSMESIRQACFPLWARYAETLKKGPVVARPADLDHFTRLFPDRARYLQDRAELLAGTEQWRQWSEPGSPDPLAMLAHLAHDTMRYSAFLGLAEPDPVVEEQLMQVAIRQAGLKLEPGTPASEVLALLHAHLVAHHEHHSAFQWDGSHPPDPPPAHLPGLVALIGLKYELIIVMPQVDRALISGTDWAKVRELVSNEFTGIMLATPWQLRLLACVDMAQDLYLRSFDQVWGSEVLVDCQPTEYRLMRTAAALPVRILMERFPADYVTTREEDLGDLIHDVQNLLLNVQLRSELMARMRGIPSRHPPEPLPGRETPPHQRVAANLGHFRWWADHLMSGWLKSCPGEYE